MVFPPMTYKKRPVAASKSTFAPQLSIRANNAPEEAARVRVRLLRELASTGEPMVGTHLPFPSVCRASVAGDVFRWVPALWEY
jgi:hypothetical protein